MTATLVTTERAGRVLTVRIGGPTQHLMSPALLRQFEDAVEGAVSDRSIGAVVITGPPDGFFIRHFDPATIARAAQAPGPPLSYRRALALTSIVGALSRLPGAARILDRSPVSGVMDLVRSDRTCRRMNESDKVFIAAVHGMAFGGAFVIAMACDLRLVAAGDHPIGAPEVNLGFVPPSSAQRLALSIGQAKTMELLLGGGMITPSEAVELGLAQKAVPAESLEEEAHRLADRMSRHSPAMVRELKRAVYSTARRGLRSGLRSERAGFAAGASHRASQEALLALADGLAEVPDADQAGYLAAWDRLADGTRIDMTPRD